MLTRAKRALTLIKYSDPAVRSTFMDELFPEEHPHAPLKKPKAAEKPPVLNAALCAGIIARMTPGARIMHSRFGPGTVLEIKNGIIKTDIGGKERSFALAFAVSAGIIKPLDQ